MMKYGLCAIKGWTKYLQYRTQCSIAHSGGVRCEVINCSHSAQVSKSPTFVGKIVYILVKTEDKMNEGAGRETAPTLQDIMNRLV